VYGIGNTRRIPHIVALLLSASVYALVGTPQALILLCNSVFRASIVAIRFSSRYRSQAGFNISTVCALPSA